MDKIEWGLESGVELNSLVEVVGHLLHHLENTFAEADSIFDGDCCIVLHHDLLRAKDVCHEVSNHGLAASKELVAQEPHELSGSITSFKKAADIVRDDSELVYKIGWCNLVALFSLRQLHKVIFNSGVYICQDFPRIRQSVKLTHQSGQ